MWQPLLEPKFHLLSRVRRELRYFGQELAHYAVHTHPGTVLWVDGEHGFDPYDFAELNLQRGRSADEGADRVLVKRCMTAFNWELALDKHLAEKLDTTDVSLVIACPYDALFCHEELADWEQEDYLRYSLGHLKRLVAKHQVPILALVDMDRYWRTHPTMAQMTYQGTESHWRIERPDRRWKAVEQTTGQVIDPYLRERVTLLDFVPEQIAVSAPVPAVLPHRSRKVPRRLRH